MVLNSILKAWKEVGHKISWKGKTTSLGDSFLSQSIWWIRGVKGGGGLAEGMLEEATGLAKRGLVVWHQVWDEAHGHWYSAEVLRQKLGLGLDATNGLKTVLDQIPESWPTNLIIADADPVKEWQWQDGTVLQDTRTRNVYKLMDMHDKWWVRLNHRWRREGSRRFWKARCRHIWNGTPFPKYNLWNWRVLSGSLLTGEKMRSWPGISGLCPWCKVARESMIDLFWSCPCLKSFWLEVRS